MSSFRCGYVAIVGRPNAGKSTFLNKALGQKVSITSRKAQTTRNRIIGILNREDAQVVLVDTPGHHEAWSRINKAMVREVDAALSEVDAVLLLVDLVPAVKAAKAGKAVLSKGDEVLLERCAATKRPVVLGLNKIDLVPQEWALPVLSKWAEVHDFHAIVPMSALNGLNADAAMEELVQVLPEHPPVFPDDQLMDATERFLVAEIIREKLFHNLDQELPYSVAVVVEDFDESERDTPDRRVRILAVILVERSSQKGIVIGKGGSMLKRVGTQARKELNRILGARVHLELHVRVQKDWTNSARVLKDLGLES